MKVLVAVKLFSLTWTLHVESDAWFVADGTKQVSVVNEFSISLHDEPQIVTCELLVKPWPLITKLKPPPTLPCVSESDDTAKL